MQCFSELRVLAPNKVVVAWHARWSDRELASQIIERKE